MTMVMAIKMMVMTMAVVVRMVKTVVMMTTVAGDADADDHGQQGLIFLHLLQLRK